MENSLTFYKANRIVTMQLSHSAFIIRIILSASSLEETRETTT